MSRRAEDGLRVSTTTPGNMSIFLTALLLLSAIFLTKRLFWVRIYTIHNNYDYALRRKLKRANKDVRKMAVIQKRSPQPVVR